MSGSSADSTSGSLAALFISTIGIGCVAALVCLAIAWCTRSSFQAWLMVPILAGAYPAAYLVGARFGDHLRRGEDDLRDDPAMWGAGGNPVNLRNRENMLWGAILQFLCGTFYTSIRLLMGRR